MNDYDADSVFARLISAWPTVELPDPTVEIWHEHLKPLRADLAMDAVRELEVSSKWFPSIAEFRAAYGRAAEYDRIAKAEDRGLPRPGEPRPSREAVHGLVEKARASIDAAEQAKRDREAHLVRMCNGETTSAPFRLTPAEVRRVRNALVEKEHRENEAVSASAQPEDP